MPQFSTTIDTEERDIRAEPVMIPNLIASSTLLAVGALLAGTFVVPVGSVGQDLPVVLPFAPGDTLIYQGRFGRFGASGTGIMTVADAELDGHPMLRFDFDFEGRVLFRTVRDETSSWLDPETFTSHRYEKDESHPLGSRRESVRIFPSERRWTDEHGDGGETPSGNPLDELSFLFLIRTMDLEVGTEHTVNRHFDEARSPVRITVLREDAVSVPAGNFAVTVVQMDVTDPDRFGGDGRVVLYLARDANRTPVMIESSVPIAGSLVLSLKEYTQAKP